MATVRCFGCGVEKDPHAKEFYTQSDRLVQDVPIDPLFVMCCEGRGEHAEDWRVVVVCHGCFERLDPDMWISSDCWKLLDPTVPFERLPPHNETTCGNEEPEDIVALAEAVLPSAA